MKTYTEIEKLADEVYPHTDMGKLKSHIGFINGYNQCQEDMADKIEIKWNEYRTVTTNEDAWSFKQWLISSLNKQD